MMTMILGETEDRVHTPVPPRPAPDQPGRGKAGLLAQRSHLPKKVSER